MGMDISQCGDFCHGKFCNAVQATPFDEMRKS